MNLHHHPELLDRLASAYALGTLRGGARRRFEAQARDHAPVRAAALVWQSRVAGLTELQRPEAPSAAVWTRIDNQLRVEREDATMAAARADAARPRSGSPRLGWWRAAAGACALVAVATVGLLGEQRHRLGGEIAALQTRLARQPQIAYVAVLHDGQSRASLLVTLDPSQHQLTLQRVGTYQEAADKSLQLWALPPQGPPRSLGVLGRQARLQLETGEDTVGGAPALAVSLEPLGGVPGERGPTGPVLFQGSLIKRL